MKARGSYAVGLYQSDGNRTVPMVQLLDGSGLGCNIAVAADYSDSYGFRYNFNNKKCGINVSANYLYKTATDLFTVAGSVGATAYNNTSDIRKKDIIENVELTLDEIANSPLFKFKWKDNEDDNGIHVGSSAQYWKNVLPEAVTQSNDDMKTLSMQYGNIALESVVSLAREVRKLKEEIVKLKKG